MRWSLSLRIHAVLTAVFVNPAVSYDGTLCDCVEIFRYPPSCSKQEGSSKYRSFLQNILHISRDNSLHICIFIYGRRFSVFRLLRMCPNGCEYMYKNVAINILLSCQYHSAKQRTSEQQHSQLCICTASCCVLREDH